jgi:hypothetical protein
MVPLTVLWIPILVSSALVFVAGFLAWMVLPHHRSDFRQLPEEERILSTLRAVNVPAGQYTLPYVKDWKTVSPDTMAAIEQGPAGFMIVRKRGKVKMGPQLVQYFLWLVVMNVFVAYVTGRALPAGTNYLDVFQIAGTVAILGYAGASIPNSIWFSRPWSVTVKEVIDSIVFGLVTAGVFGWLWPK